MALCLSLFVLAVYARAHDPRYGWTRLVRFGSDWEGRALPSLQRTPHYVDPAPAKSLGSDGQFYAQMALDPSLRDPSFGGALDNPSYRARRIGLPALAFGLAGGEPRRIVQVYALANLFGWFVLLGAMLVLLRPWTWRGLLCLGATMLGFGAVTSMLAALIDLPAATMIFTGAALGSPWGRCGALAAAVLTRETSVLAVPGLLLDLRRPALSADWLRPLGRMALAVAPFAAWFVYVHHRFGALPGSAAGAGNFALPLVGVGGRLVDGVRQCAGEFPGPAYRHWRWLISDFACHEVLTAGALCIQGLYFLVRRDGSSPFWRMGGCFLALGTVLGPAVWADTSSAARVLLPMTVCFYLRLAHERAGWFWPFLLLGSLSIPYGVHLFWTGS